MAPTLRWSSAAVRVVSDHGRPRVSVLPRALTSNADRVNALPCRSDSDSRADPASRSGRSVRVIGYSETAGAILTVILVPREGPHDWWGANAWRSSDRDIRIYEKGA